MHQNISVLECTHSSFSAHLRLVGQPYFLRLWVSSLYRVSARRWGIPSQAKISITMTAFWQWCPARCRTKQSSFSSSLLLRITWKTGWVVCRSTRKDLRHWCQLFVCRHPAVGFLLKILCWPCVGFLLKTAYCYQPLFTRILFYWCLHHSL